jgi:hypothetical protein
MAQGTIGLRFNVDVANSPAQVDNLTQSVASLNDELAKATEDKDWKSVAMLTKAIEDATSARGRIIQQANQSQNNENRQNAKGGIFGGQDAWVFQQALNQITRGIIQSMDAALNAAKQRASGDYAGAAVTEVRARGEIAGQGIGAGVGAGAGAAAYALTGGTMPWLIPLLAGIGGEIGKFLGGIDAKKMEEDLAYSAQYKNALPSIDTLNQNFGGNINNKTEAENNRYGLAMHRRASEATAGTGLTTQAFIEAMKQMGGYGIRNETQALSMARNQALWSRFTGTDLTTIQKYAGQAYRYGGDTGAVSTAYGGLMAQGMAKGQFSEFLNSMERILEEGIAKGFVRSSEEIAGNMQMLYKLSGGSRLWQGEQGAQRLSQMNMAISNATNLQSVEDVISFGVARDLLGTGPDREAMFEQLTRGGDGLVAVTGDANFRSAASGADNILGTVRQGSKVDILGIEGDYARVNNNGQDGYIHQSLLDMRGYNQSNGNVYTGTYADIMQLLERGVSADLLKGQFEAVNRLEGDNTAGIIERFMRMYGLNYTGASQVWGMMRDARGDNGEYTFNAQEYERQIKALQTDPKYISDSEKLTTAINRMTENLVSIGKIKFDETEFPTLQRQAADVAAILAKLNEPPPATVDPLSTLPVTLPKTDKPEPSLRAFFSGEMGLREERENGRIIQALLTAPPTNEGRYDALSGEITKGTTNSNAYSLPDNGTAYYTHRAAVAAATDKNSEGGSAITSNELRELIPVLRSLAEAIKSDLFAGKSDEEIHVWLTGGR